MRCEICVKDYIIRLTNSIISGILFSKEVMCMKKSVYSIVLMDDVIRAVDAEAYRLGTSRSNLINQILAQHLSCVTPEMRMRDIFESVAEQIGTAFQIQQQRSASLMTIRSALEYRYRPTISYKVELNRVPDEYLGTLKVQIRTQSQSVSMLFNEFFVYRAGMESEEIRTRGYGGYACQLSDGYFTRKLINSGKADPEQTGEAIGEYLTDLNSAIKAYFADPQGFRLKAAAYEKSYKELLDRNIL